MTSNISLGSGWGDTIPSDTGAYVTRAGGTTPSTAPLSYVNVLDYGVVGDGTTDDTSNFEAARTAAQNLGRPLLAPPGLTIKVSEIVSAWNGARWYFHGSYLDIQTDHTSTGRYVNLNNLEDVALHAIRVKQSNATGRNGVYGLFSIFSGGDILLEDCWADGGESAGFWTGTPGVTTTTGVVNFRIVRPRSINNYADGIHISRGATDGWIVDPYTSGNGDDNVALNSIKSDDSNAHTYAQIARVHILNPNGHAQNSGRSGYSANSSGVAIYGAADCHTIGGTTTGTPNSGWTVNAATGTGATYTPVRCDAIGHSAIGCKEGFIFSASTDCTADGCTAEGNSDCGAQFIGSTRAIIRGGKFTGNTGAGLYSTGAGASNNVLVADLHGNTGGATSGTLTDTTLTSCITA